MSSSTFAGTSSAIKMSGASGRTGCVIGLLPYGQSQSKRPRSLLRVHAATCATSSSFEEKIELRSSTCERRAGSEREGVLLHLLAVREERKRASSGARAQCELRAGDPRPDGVEPEPEVPRVVGVRARATETF